jgi:hypothetical protein
VDFDNRDTIRSDKGDQHAFKNAVAVEGYQKSNLKDAGLTDLHYGVLVRDIPPQYESVELHLWGVADAEAERAEFALPTLGGQTKPVHRRVGFEGQTFPPPGWQRCLLPGNVCRPEDNGALTGAWSLLCQDRRTSAGALVRAGLTSVLPGERMSWRLAAEIAPETLAMGHGEVVHPLAFLHGDNVVAAACLRKIQDHRYVAGVTIRGADGGVREHIDVGEGEVFLGRAVRWELDLSRLGTRQTTGVLRLDGRVVVRISGHDERRTRHRVRRDRSPARRTGGRPAHRSSAPNRGAPVSGEAGKAPS